MLTQLQNSLSLSIHHRNKSLTTKGPLITKRAGTSVQCKMVCHYSLFSLGRKSSSRVE